MKNAIRVVRSADYANARSKETKHTTPSRFNQETNSETSRQRSTSATVGRPVRLCFALCLEAGAPYVLRDTGSGCPSHGLGPQLGA